MTNTVASLGRLGQHLFGLLIRFRALTFSSFLASLKLFYFIHNYHNNGWLVGWLFGLLFACNMHISLHSTADTNADNLFNHFFFIIDFMPIDALDKDYAIN